MNVTYGIRWNDSKSGRLLGLALAALLALPLLADPRTTASMARASQRLVSIIVREDPGAGAAPERAVEDLGGVTGRHMDIIRGFEAKVPSHSLPALQKTAGVFSVTPNARVRLLDLTGDASATTTGSLQTVDGAGTAPASSYDPDLDPGSMQSTTKSIKARQMWQAGFTGAGVDVALIDSGVVPVEGLTARGKVVNGADLSFESQSDDLRYLDTYGHGTHMAGIIAGRDGSVTAGREQEDNKSFMGVAPGARIVSVKVADETGATDVSQVIAGIDWVVQHRHDNGMNIRVLNLSFGTDGVQAYELDPLTYAAEVAWHKGIVVVVSAGNKGFGTPKLNNPAYDPYLLAVGASDTAGTHDTADDVVPDWSSRGDGVRNPDLVAPGKSITSLRDPGSFIDEHHPEGYVTERFFRGSGTSQAAAVVSGAAALLIQQRPNITPDQLKALLMRSASPLPIADPVAQGQGTLNLKTARTMATPQVVQTWPRATGTGSLELARGSAHLVDDQGVELRGEVDIFGRTWDGIRWSADAWAGRTWNAGSWNGSAWTGGTWSGRTWAGDAWAGIRWSGTTWSGRTWDGIRWSGRTWDGIRWSGDSWDGIRWSGIRWSGDEWSGRTWDGIRWSGIRWSGSSWE